MSVVIKGTSTQALLEILSTSGVQRVADFTVHLETVVNGALSDREKTVLDLTLAGRTDDEIARELSISPRTVQFYRARILSKQPARGA